MNQNQATLDAQASPAGAAHDSRPAGRPFTRWRAAGTHLLICAGIAAAVLTLMVLFWYTPPLFEAMGGSGLALILIGVDVVMGPALTLVVFRSGKRGLKFDLVVIALFQIGALLYGCHIVSLARPAFIVFVKDQLQVASVVDIAAERFAEAKYRQFRAASWSGPQYVFGDWPREVADRQRLLDAALAGEDLQDFPKYFAPYEQGRAEILAKAQPLSRVRATEPQTARVIDAWLARSGADERGLLYLPVRAREAWLAALIDRASARPVKLLVTEKL
jgi:hypothetical protein